MLYLSTSNIRVSEHKVMDITKVLCTHAGERERAWYQNIHAMLASSAKTHSVMHRVIKSGGKFDVSETVRDTIPEWLRSEVVAHFTPNSQLPDTLQVHTDPLIGSGVWTKSDALLEYGDVLGVYGGTVIFDSELIDVMTLDNDKVFEVRVWNNSVFIDGSNDWHSLVNHRWNWPYDGNPPLLLRDYFSNTLVDEDGIMRVTAFSIGGDTELTLDYGHSYWSGYNRLPIWDLSSMDEDIVRLLKARDHENKVVALLDASVVTYPESWMRVFHATEEAEPHRPTIRRKLRN